MDFKTAIKRTFRGIGNYRGIASPAEFWIGASALSALAWLDMLPWPIAIGWGNTAITSEIFYGLTAVQTASFLYLGAIVVPLIARRLRDAGRSPFLAIPMALTILLNSLMNLALYANWYPSADEATSPIGLGVLEALSVLPTAVIIFTLIMVLGKSKNAPKAEGKYCSNCGAIVAGADAAFCAGCGSPIS